MSNKVDKVRPFVTALADSLMADSTDWVVYVVRGWDGKRVKLIHERLAITITCTFNGEFGQFRPEFVTRRQDHEFSWQERKLLLPHCKNLYKEFKAQQEDIEDRKKKEQNLLKVYDQQWMLNRLTQ